MHVFMEHNGVKVRVNCGQPPSLETMTAIKKMVTLVINQESNAKGKTVNQPTDRS